MFPPGTQWYYSNSGYVVLGLIVAKVSGQSFPEFLRQRIFAPLKMDHTVAYVKGQNEITNRAYGHTKEGNTWKQTDQSPTSATLGDGGIYSSLEDLAKWDEALRTNKLLSKEEMQPALTPVTLPLTSDKYRRSTALARQLRPPRRHCPSPTASAGSSTPTAPTRACGTTAKPWASTPTSSASPDKPTTNSAAMPASMIALAGVTIIVLCNRTDISPEYLALQIATLFLAYQNKIEL